MGSRNKDSWKRALVRYLLLQVPGTVLLVLVLFWIRPWLELPEWLVWTLVTMWVVKDAILFPFVWRAYQFKATEPGNSMVGLQGIATERLAPHGYIRIRGELWRAELLDGGHPVEAGRAVRVRDVQGLTLLVEPVP